MMEKEIKNIEKIVESAASNVACETGVVPVETLQSIEAQLMGLSCKSEQSFIYGLYRKVVGSEEENQRHVRK